MKHQILILLLSTAMLHACKKDDSQTPVKTEFELTQLVSYTDTTGSNWGYEIIATSDNNMVVSFMNESLGKAHIIKYNTNGSELWHLILKERIYQICELSNGELIGIGPSSYLIRIAANGSSSSIFTPVEKHNSYSNILKTSDQFIYLIGHDFFDESFICKYDENFNLVWKTNLSSVYKKSFSVDKNNNLIFQDSHTNKLYVMNPDGAITKQINISESCELKINDIISVDSNLLLAMEAGNINSDVACPSLMSIDYDGNVNWEYTLPNIQTPISFNKIITFNNAIYACGSITETYWYSDLFMAKFNLSGQISGKKTIGTEMTDESLSTMCLVNNCLFACGGRNGKSKGESVIFRHCTN